MDFSKMPFIYWSKLAKVSYLQRLIIVYSIMYYEHNESCITDKEYDKLSSQLLEMQKSLTEEELRSTDYYYALYDFDGNTGFDIPDKLIKADRDYLTHLSKYIYSKWKGIDNVKKKRPSQ